MEWIIAGGVSWFFGHLGLFVVLTLLVLALPRTMAVFVFIISLAVIWGGGTIVLYILGALFGLCPPGSSGFTLVAMLTALPSFFMSARLAKDVASLGQGR